MGRFQDWKVPIRMLKPILVEHFGKADRTLEIYQGNCNNVWAFHKDGETIIFRSGTDAIHYLYGDRKGTPRKYCTTVEFDQTVGCAEEYEDLPFEEVDTIY